MKNYRSWVKPEILAQPAYKVKTTDYRIKLNQNESPWDWPREIKEDISQKIIDASWNRYPDLTPENLKEKIARRHGLSSNQIVVGKGSNEVLQGLGTATLGNDSTVLTLSPTFAIYKMIAEQSGAGIIESKLDRRFLVSSEDLLAKATKANLTILCNPNSPTGTLMENNLIQTVIETAPGLVVLDEAYAEFSGASVIDWIERYPNLVVTRTFSKVFALAGFRVGYAVMSSELAEQVQKCMLPFNLDLPSVLAAESVLDHLDLVRTRTETIIEERDKMIRHLNTIHGIRAYDSATNFFLLRSDRGSEFLFKELSRLGLLIRDVSAYPRCENLVRVSVGTPEENEAFIKAVVSIQ